MKKILGVIPARYASTRFPGKPLVQLGGVPMIERVYRQVSGAELLTDIVVATDHQGIFDCVLSFGGKVVMTSEHHPSGTDRCYDAFNQLGETCDYVINIQGDEPFVSPRQIDLLAGALDGTVELATLIKAIDDSPTLHNPNVVKVVRNLQGNALYFSRQPIPYFRGVDLEYWHLQHSYWKHLGMYAYRSDVLQNITQLRVSSLERTESLEQLRWLEHGYSIRTLITTEETHGIDTPEDLVRAEAYLKNLGAI